MYLDWYSKNGLLVSDVKLSERAHDEMLKYCIHQAKVKHNQSLKGQIRSGIKSKLSSLNTAVNMFEDSIRSTLANQATPAAETNTVTSSTTVSNGISSTSSILEASASTTTFTSSTTLSSSPISVPTLAPFSIANTVNLLTSGWQRSHSSLSSHSNQSFDGSYNTTVGGVDSFSPKGNVNTGGGDVGPLGYLPALGGGGVPDASRGLSHLKSLPSMYRDAQQLSKLKSVLSSPPSSNSNYNDLNNMSAIRDNKVQEEAFLFKYLQKNDIQNIIAKDGKYVHVERPGY